LERAFRGAFRVVRGTETDTCAYRCVLAELMQPPPEMHTLERVQEVEEAISMQKEGSA